MADAVCVILADLFALIRNFIVNQRKQDGHHQVQASSAIPTGLSYLLVLGIAKQANKTRSS